jgi:thioredoxin 1
MWYSKGRYEFIDACKLERYHMKKLKVFGFIIAILGFMSLDAGKMQDGISGYEIDTVKKNSMQTVDTQRGKQKIQLFMYDECPYCVRVATFLKQQNLMDKVEFIDAGVSENRELLRSVSGRTQAPYLIDLDADVKMPESLDIIAYFSKKFATTIPPVVECISGIAPIEVYEQKKYNNATFLSDIQASKKPVMILVSTTWCPPCKIFKPIFLQVAQQFADVCTFICIDGDVDSGIRDQLGVQGYPSVVCYKNGKRINSENYRSKEGLVRLVHQLVSH